MTGPPPYFFFSYARSDASDGPYLGQFFTDLRTEVRVLTGLAATTELGFFDTRNIHIGSAWSDDLLTALASSRTFLALCSPSYFNSEYCGREWGVFAERVKQLQGVGGKQSPKLVPLMWTPIVNPPAVVAAVQYDHFELGDLYSRRGIRYLLKLKRNEDEYQEFLGALAARVVAMAEDAPLPPASAVVPFDHAPDVFGNQASIADLAGGRLARPSGAASTPASAQSAVGPASTASTVPASKASASTASASTAPATDSALPQIRAPGGGPRFVTFVVAATSVDELPDVRQHRIYYGPRYEDWAPYRPHHPRGLCSAVQEVAGQQNMTSTVAQLESGIGALLDYARGRNEIVVIVVDIWTTTMDRFKEPLAEYDRSNEPTTGVLVPWDAADHETNDRRDELVLSLREALRRSLLRQDGLVQPEIQSYEAFRAALSRALARLQAKIVETSEFVRDTSGRPRTPPTIEGPLG